MLKHNTNSTDFIDQRCTMKSFKTFLTSAFLAATAGALSFSATANVLVNGGFENPNVNSGSWQYFSASDVDGWNGSNIEIWNNLNNVSAFEGNQFAELNSHPGTGQAFTIFQDFSTVQGQTYNVSFAYRARSNNNEAFQADIRGLTNLESWLIDDHTTSQWSTFSSSFVADSTLSSIAFTTIVPSTGTVGNFIDDVKVSAVAEPATLALLGLGIASLGFTRRRLNK